MMSGSGVVGSLVCTPSGMFVNVLHVSTHECKLRCVFLMWNLVGSTLPDKFVDFGLNSVANADS